MHVRGMMAFRMASFASGSVRAVRLMWMRLALRSVRRRVSGNRVGGGAKRP